MESTEREGDLAWIIHKEIVENEKQRRELMARNGMLLNQMLDNKLYQTILGDENGVWAGYLGEIEIFYSRNKVFNLMRVCEKFQSMLIEPSIWCDAPVNRLAEVVSLLDHDNYLAWIAKATTLTSRDWNIEVRQAKGLVTEEDEHNHNFTKYKICDKCGRKEKEHDTETAAS